MEDDEYGGLSEWEETEDNTNVVMVDDVYHSPGTRDELKQMLCSYGSCVYGDCQNDVSSDMRATASRRWRVLKVVVVHFPGVIRHEVAINARRKAVCGGGVISDNVHLCCAPGTLGDFVADIGKQVISDHSHHPSCASNSGCPKFIALDNKLNLTSHNNDLDQDKNKEIVDNETEGVKVENNLIGYNNNPQKQAKMEIVDTENEVFKAKKVFSSENHLENGKRKRENKLTLEYIQDSQAKGLKLEDAAGIAGVSRSTFKRICRKYGIKNWKEKGKSLYCPNTSLEHFNETLGVSCQQSFTNVEPCCHNDEIGTATAISACWFKTGRISKGRSTSKNDDGTIEKLRLEVDDLKENAELREETAVLRAEVAVLRGQLTERSKEK